MSMPLARISQSSLRSFLLAPRFSRFSAARSLSGASPGADAGLEGDGAGVGTGATAGASAEKAEKEDSFSDFQEDAGEPEEVAKVEMWNPDAPVGPEWGGPRGMEPTRHGDWAQKGRCTDF